MKIFKNKSIMIGACMIAVAVAVLLAVKFFLAAEPADVNISQTAAVTPAKTANTPAVTQTEKIKNTPEQSAQAQIYTTTDTSLAGMYKCALDSIQPQNYSTLIMSGPHTFEELSAADKTAVIEHIEIKTGGRVLFKTHDECLAEGYARQSKNISGAIEFLPGNIDFSMFSTKTGDDTYMINITFYAAPVAASYYSFEAKIVDDAWQIIFKGCAVS